MIAWSGAAPPPGSPAARRVLLADGPLAGQSVPRPDYGVIRYEQPPPPLLALITGEPAGPALPETGTYHVHKYQVAGRIILLGSVHPVLDAGIVNAMFWRWLASPLAAELAEDPP